MADLRKRRNEVLSPAGMAGLGINGADGDTLRAYADLSRCLVLFPGDPVFGPGRELALAVVLWGSVFDSTCVGAAVVALPDVAVAAVPASPILGLWLVMGSCIILGFLMSIRRTGKVHGKGAKLCAQAAAEKVPSAEAAEAAVAAEASPEEAQGKPPQQDDGAAPSFAAPVAVVLLLDLKSITAEWQEAKRLLEEKLAREKEKREAKRRRVLELQEEVGLLLEVRGGCCPWLRCCFPILAYLHPLDLLHLGRSSLLPN